MHLVAQMVDKATLLEVVGRTDFERWHQDTVVVRHSLDKDN